MGNALVGLISQKLDEADFFQVLIIYVIDLAYQRPIIHICVSFVQSYHRSGSVF